MARRKLIWHIGLAHAPRPVIAANLAAHRDLIEDAGVRVAADAEESRLATHELLRTHAAAGLARDEVEGWWSRICDRVWEHKGVSVLTTPDLCVADKDQVRLALDALIGVEVHLVATLDSFSQQLYGGWLAELRSGRTTGWDTFVSRILEHAAVEEPGHRQAEEYWAGHDLLPVLARWGWTLRSDRVHVVAAEDVGEHWHVFAEVAGLPVDELPCVFPSYAGPAGVAVLRKVNRQLESPIGPTSVELLLEADHDRAAVPSAPTRSLRPLAEQWQVALDEAGYDVRGDLPGLTDEGEARPLPGPRDQLAVAVDALADALAENARLQALASDLERDRDRIDRKRRKWKRRARASSAA